MIKNIVSYLRNVYTKNIEWEEELYKWAVYLEELQEAINEVPERQCKTRDTDMLLGRWYKKHGDKKEVI